MAVNQYPVKTSGNALDPHLNMGTIASGYTPGLYKLDNIYSDKTRLWDRSGKSSFLFTNLSGRSIIGLSTDGTNSYTGYQYSSIDYTAVLQTYFSPDSIKTNLIPSKYSGYISCGFDELNFPYSGSSFSAAYSYNNVLFATTATGIFRSTDGGITWTQVLSNSSTGGGYIAWNGSNLYVYAVPSVTTNIYTSTDGITWTARTAPTSTATKSLSFGNGLFVLITGSPTITNTIYTSSDGISWTSRATVTSRGILRPSHNGLTGASSRWLAGVQGNATTPLNPRRSTDGITWSEALGHGLTTSVWLGAEYGNGIFVVYEATAASSATGTTRYSVSTDGGSTWSVTAATLNIPNTYEIWQYQTNYSANASLYSSLGLRYIEDKWYYFVYAGDSNAVVYTSDTIDGQFTLHEIIASGNGVWSGNFDPPLVTKYGNYSLVTGVNATNTSNATLYKVMKVSNSTAHAGAGNFALYGDCLGLA